MENENKSTKQIIIGVVLVVLLLSLAGYTIYQNSQLNESNAFLEDEKDKIEQELDEMVAKYDVAIDDNSALAEELRLEREDIVLFRDSVKNLKQTNYSIIRRYRGKISSLEASNQELFRQNDSLRISNQILAQEIDSANVYIVSQTAILDSLNVQNAELAEKIGIGAQLQVNSLKVLSMKERNNGKLVATTRANRTDALRINFTIAENALADKTQRQAMIQVLDPKGQVVHNIGSATLEDGTDIEFTDETSIDYDNVRLDVISLIEVDRKSMMKGTYTVSVFLDNKLVSLSGFILK